MEPRDSSTREREEPASASASPSRFRRAWTAAKTIAAGILIGALVEVMTGALSSGFSAVAARLWGGDPMTIAVVHQDDPCVGWVIPRPPASIVSPPTDENSAEYLDWVAHRGGVDAGTTTVDLILRGNSAKAVVLRDMRVVVTKRRPPVEGTHLATACGGPATRRLFDVNLDRQPPSVLAKAETSPGDEPQQPVEFPYQVAQGDPEVITIVAKTRDCDCSWVAELDWVDGEEQHTTVIDNDGRPFRTTSTNSSEVYVDERTG
ncbi:MAG: hypothetical protein ACRDPK_17440 [Carbonactinosporaceae bacterium]